MCGVTVSGGAGGPGEAGSHGVEIHVLIHKASKLAKALGAEVIQIIVATGLDQEPVRRSHITLGQAAAPHRTIDRPRPRGAHDLERTTRDAHAYG